MDVDEFRGFALADGWALLIFVNGPDSKAAQMFTVAHELVHIRLGRSGVSNYPLSDPAHPMVEAWCNDMAAELLVQSRMMHTSGK